MVVLHKPSTVSTPAFLLQLLGIGYFLMTRLSVAPQYWPDPDNYAEAADNRVWWYLIHGLVVIGQTFWGWPLVSWAKRDKGNRLPAVLFFVSMTISVATALPIIRVSNQAAFFGLGIYAASVLYNTVFVLYLLDIGKGLLLTPPPTEYFSRQRVHAFVGRLEALQWYAGYQLVVYCFRYQLLVFPLLNTFLHWAVLIWHFYLLFYFGSHKPRYESAVGLVEQAETKKGN